MQKAGDLFLGVIDFFGILVPGAIFVFLYQDRLLPLFDLPPLMSDSASWVPVFVLAYVVGHFLLGFSVPLNRLAMRRPSPDTKAYFTATSGKVALPAGVEKTPGNVYYAAFSLVRLRSGAAVAEIERQAGEYKLFRSLTLLFLINAPVSLALSDRPLMGAGLSMAAAALSYYRFQWLLDWTYRITYDFHLQLRAQDEPAPPVARD